MAPPILTLTTDFGLDDHYVGTMKGVILGICPGARIVDISHGVKPFQISEGAYLIAQGQVIEEGTPRALAESPRARSVYLGERFRLHD